MIISDIEQFTEPSANLFPFSALTLLVGRYEGHAIRPVQKVGCWFLVEMIWSYERLQELQLSPHFHHL